MRCVQRSPRARVRGVLAGRPQSSGERERWYRRVGLVLAAVTVSACTEGVIPTAPSNQAAPGINSASKGGVDRATAPATLAWEAKARDLVTRAGRTPLDAVRIYALLGVAQYGAAVAADDALGVEVDDGGHAAYEVRRAAIGAASNAVLSYLFPPTLLVPNASGEMAAQLAAEAIGANGKIHPWYARGLPIGEAMGRVMTDRASLDGWSRAWNGVVYAKGTPLVAWYQFIPPAPKPTPPPAGHQWARITPYFLDRADQFKAPPPPAFGSPAFVNAVALVHDTVFHRTAYQLSEARFWNLSVGTPTALGYWDERAAAYILEDGLNDREASHVYALTNAAAMDASIGCWETKYRELVLRPSQVDPTIAARVGGLPLGLPNHPSYPSGHSCVSAGAATVLEAFFPGKTTELEDGVTRAGNSRVYGGIHYQFDVVEGQALGRRVGAWALNYDRTRGLLTSVGR